MIEENTQKQTQQIELKVIKLTTKVKKIKNKQHKTILYDISLELKSGELIGLLGHSGSGKTILLNFLAQRQIYLSSFFHYGKYYINNNEIKSLNEIKNNIGFVEQEFTLKPQWTLMQYLEYYFTLRWNENDTHENRKLKFKKEVDKILNDLGLNHCKNTKIGSLLQDGLSGGEQRRVTIAIELIQKPIILFLDEPTTGLDSYNANQIIDILKNLANQGILVIASIHSPNNQILKKFDKTIILSQGRMVFYDNPNKIQERINQLSINQELRSKIPIENFIKLIDINEFKIEQLKQIQNQDQFQQESQYVLQDESLDQIQEEIQIEQKFFERLEYIISFQKNDVILKEELLNDDEYLFICKNLNQKNQQRSFLFQIKFLFFFVMKLQTENMFFFILRFLLIIFVTFNFWLAFNDMNSYDRQPTIAYISRGGFFSFLSDKTLLFATYISSSLILQQKKNFKKEIEFKLYNKYIWIFVNYLTFSLIFILYVLPYMLFYQYIFDLNKDTSLNVFWFLLTQVIIMTNYGVLSGFIISIITDQQSHIPIFIVLFLFPFILVRGYIPRYMSQLTIIKLFSYLSIPRFTFQINVLNEFYDQQYLYEDHCPKFYFNKQQCNPFHHFDFVEQNISQNIIIIFVLLFTLLIILLVTFTYIYRDQNIEYRNKNKNQILINNQFQLKYFQTKLKI